MSVLIKGMEMPTSCWDCPCIDGKNGYCQLRKEYVYGEAPRSCPLVPAPPHGRLIDADALMKSDRMVGKLMMYGGEYVYTQAEIDRAPTIIPAEEGEA